MATHDLKIESRWLQRVQAGKKRAEIRKHDRDYQVGDVLRLFEVNEYGNRKTRFVERDERGRFVNNYVDNDPILVRVTHVLPGAQADGIAPDYCVLSIEVMDSPIDKLREALR